MNEEIIERKNLFCVVAKEVTGEYGVRDIQTCSAWDSNPYGEEYVVVPDELVPAIMETNGFFDIELNEDGTEIVSFTAREIPNIPDPEPETEKTVYDEMAEAYLEGVNSIG
jgi:hypothetical protein